MLQEFRSQKITWDKANNNIYERVEAHEGDSNGRKLIVQVLNDGIVEDLTGSTLSLAWQTKDRANFGLDAFASTDITKGLFEIYYTTGMLTNIGLLEASLVLVDASGRIESKSFKITVSKSNVDDEAVQSDNSFTALTEALITVNQYDARIAANTQDIINLDTKTMSHLAEKAQKIDLDTTNTNVSVNTNAIALKADKTEVNSLTTNKADKSELAVERARIDSFTSLASGSTTGDAELMDARVGTEGKTYANAGGSIRGQINELKKDFVQYEAGLTPIFATWIKGSLNTDGTINTATTWRLVTQNMLQYDRELTFHIDNGYTVQMAEYDATGTFTRRHSITDGYVCSTNQKFKLSIYKTNETVSDEAILFYQNIWITGNIYTQLNKGMFVNKQIISPSNYAELLPDLNNAPSNSVFTIVPSAVGKPLNMPSDIKYDQYYTLRTTGVANDGGGTLQELIDGRYGNIWCKVKKNVSGEWFDWKKISNSESTSKITITVSPDGTGDFTSFTKAVRFARNYYATTILVDRGTYNLITEMEEVFPTYFSNYSASSTTTFPDNRGLAIGWGMKIICSAGAKFTCNRTTDDGATQSYSPLYAYNSDFELIGFNLNCKLVRYGIHDDPFNDYDADNETKKPRWRHTYSDCIIKVDNSTSSKSFRACIGGGLGLQSSINVLNCVFESVGVTDDRGVVSWHNCIIDGSKSQVVVSGCYFKTGTYQAQYYGNSTEMTTNIISNNSFKAKPFVSKTDVAYDTVNVEIIEWNNEIRA